jgi:hypothetical protein
MCIGTRNRGLSSLVAASYLLVVTTASLFHNHGPEGVGCHSCAAMHSESNHDSSDGHGSAPCCPDDHCPVCQFLAQKPAPAAEVAVVGHAEPVQQVVVAEPVCPVVAEFSAWRSRAPPTVA